MCAMHVGTSVMAVLQLAATQLVQAVTPLPTKQQPILVQPAVQLDGATTRAMCATSVTQLAMGVLEVQSLNV